MKNTKNKLIVVLLVVVMVALSIVGCANPKTDNPVNADTPKENDTEAMEKTKVRMTYWNSEETVADLLEYLAVAVPDVEIEYQFIDNSNYSTIVDTQLSAGEGPDIISEYPASALKHAQLGYLADISDIGALYSSAGTSVYTYQGGVYALPGISWFQGIYYNKAIFEENNITLPKTFDEYIDVCLQLKDLGIKPLTSGLKSWEPLLKSSMAFVTAEYLSTPAGENFGSDYREGKTTLDGTWNTYIEKWSEMISKGIYTEDMTGMDTDQALEEFALGQAAMFASGPWHLSAIQEKNPDLDLGMMPFYGTQPSAGWLIGGPGAGFAVNEASENKDAAIRVLEALSTYEGQEALWGGNAGGSSYLTGTEFELPEAFDDVATAIAAGNVYCPWNEWGDAGSAHKDYGIEMQNYFLGVQDIATTLSNVDDVVEELSNK